MLHRHRGDRPRAGRRHRAGVRGAAGGRARDRQVHAAAPRARRTCPRPGRHACWCRARSRTRRWRRAPGGSACPATPSRSRPGATSRTCSRPRVPRGRSCSRSTPSRRSATRPAPRCPAGRPGPHVHRRARRAGQGGGHRGAPDRPRHEGRRSGGSADAGACRRRGPDVRRGPSLGPAGPLRRQEPIRRRGRDGVVRDGGPGARRDRPHRAARVARIRARARPSRCRRRAGGRSPWRSRRSSEPPTGRPGVRPRGSTLAGSSWSRPSSTEAAGIPLGRAELFGASSGGVRLDDPACDLAVAAALASAATGIAPPGGVGVRGRGRAHGAGPVGAVHGPARLRRPERPGAPVIYAAPGAIGRGRGAPVRAGSTRPRGAWLGVAADVRQPSVCRRRRSFGPLEAHPKAF